MKILLTNDDGIYAPGLAALERTLDSLGEVAIVAPATEQSGVGHAITFLTPLVVEPVYDGARLRGWAVNGSPADCVKVAIAEILPWRPDLVVSGINNGLNAGINVLYSGTVAAAIEGAFFGIPSIAVSLEHDVHAPFERAAMLATQIVAQIVRRPGDGHQLYNLNFPLRALREPTLPQLRVTPMGVARYGENFERRKDPRGRTYYWATNDPPPPRTDHETDLTALEQGYVTLSPLSFDLTLRRRLDEMQTWGLRLSEEDSAAQAAAIEEPSP